MAKQKSKYSDPLVRPKGPTFASAMTTPKRYIIFFYEHYYPCGGMNDILGYSDSLKDANKMLIERIKQIPEYRRENWFDHNSCDVFDTDTWQTIDEGFDNIPLSQLENAIPTTT